MIEISYCEEQPIGGRRDYFHLNVQTATIEERAEVFPT